MVLLSVPRQVDNNRAAHALHARKDIMCKDYSANFIVHDRSGNSSGCPRWSLTLVLGSYCPLLTGSACAPADQIHGVSSSSSICRLSPRSRPWLRGSPALHCAAGHAAILWAPEAHRRPIWLHSEQALRDLAADKSSNAGIVCCHNPAALAITEAFPHLPTFCLGILVMKWTYKLRLRCD
jgi:hypothetical protein